MIYDYVNPAALRWMLPRILKARLRDWLFADYKWITRAEIIGEIFALRWKYRSSLRIQRVLSELEEIL